MTFLGPIATPLRTLVFALGGAGLAWLWFNTGPFLPVLIVVGAWIITIAIQWYAGGQITKRPTRALTLFQFRLLGIAAVSAGGAALVIVLTVWFSLDEAQKKEIAGSAQEVLAAVGAGLTAFVASVTVSAETADENIGNLVKAEFRKKFYIRSGEKFYFADGQVSASDARNGQEIRVDDKDGTANEKGIRAWRALTSSQDYGWTDWSAEFRIKRAEAIESYLQSKK